MYEIETDHGARLLRIEFGKAFWDAALIGKFMADCRSAIETLPVASTGYVTLVIFSECAIQSQETFSLMQGVVAYSKARRIALVAVGPMERMQTKRLQNGNNVRMFEDVETAERWLVSDGAIDLVPSSHRHGATIGFNSPMR